LTNTTNKTTQIPINCSDTTAIVLHTGDAYTLIVSSYEPRDGNTVLANEEEIGERIQEIRTAKEKAEEEFQAPIELLVCADWNRHHVLWRGQEAVNQQRVATEGDQIIDFVQRNGLRSLLGVGTHTWEHASLDRRSTIDLILGSQGIQDNMISCTIHPIDHGSDHKAITTEFYTTQEHITTRKRKRLYLEADWERVRDRINTRLEPLSHITPIQNSAQLDQEASDFTQAKDHHSHRYSTFSIMQT
jgi:exonuclease III